MAHSHQGCCWCPASRCLWEREAVDHNVGNLKRDSYWWVMWGNHWFNMSAGSCEGRGCNCRWCFFVVIRVASASRRRKRRKKNLSEYLNICTLAAYFHTTPLTLSYSNHIYTAKPQQQLWCSRQPEWQSPIQIINSAHMRLLGIRYAVGMSMCRIYPADLHVTSRPRR